MCPAGNRSSSRAHGRMQRRRGAGCAPNARFCRHQPFRPPDPVGNDRKAAAGRGERGFFDRHLQPREPRTARAFKTGLRNFASRAARDAPLRHCPQYRPRRREPPDPDAGRAPGRAGRHVLHSLYRKQRGEGAIRQSRNAERVPRWPKSVFSAARPRAGSSPSF